MELISQKPNYPIYRILDDLKFTDENSIIPSLTLKHHLKKIYPYANE